MNHYTFQHQELALKKLKGSDSTNRSIYHFENYNHLQKLNCVLKIPFNNDELPPLADKIKTLHAMKTKWGISIYCQARIFNAFTHREDKGINA